VAAANPCPCGHAGSPVKACRCRPDQVRRYRGRLSGPLLDRIDLHLELEPVTEEVLVGPADGESSADVLARVLQARRHAAERWDQAWPDTSGTLVNRDAQPGAVRATVGRSTQARLARAVESLGWSARTFDRCLRVARTIADLAGRDVVDDDQVDEAIAYRLDAPTGAGQP
jgi:magnesium chelatase family protein